MNLDTASVHPSLAHTIRAWAVRTPNAIALSGPPDPITYSDLDAQADDLASVLKLRGAAPGQRVGIMVERGPAAVVSIIAILKTGSTFVPMDSKAPRKRLDEMRRIAGISLEIHGNPVSGEPIVVSPRPHDHSNAVVDQTHLGYVLFTSGTTGAPKAVPVYEDSITQLIDTSQQLFSFKPGDTWSQFHSLTFDYSLWEIFGCLITGGQLRFATQLERTFPRFTRSLASQVRILSLTPSVLRRVLDDSRSRSLDLSGVKAVFVGGESFDVRSFPWFELLEESGFRGALYNLYGLTETTIVASFARMTTDQCDAALFGTCIGLPLPYFKMAILDKDRRVVPAGVVGEIAVQGCGLSGDYLDTDPKINNLRFAYLDLGQGNQRTLLTGDLGYIDTDKHEFYHLGRLDNQIKWRGRRLELEAIETALRTCSGVQEACAVLSGRRCSDSDELVAIVEVSDAPVTAWDLRSALSIHLPSEDLPSSFLFVHKLPRMASGKIDRVAAAEMLQNLP